MKLETSYVCFPCFNSCLRGKTVSTVSLKIVTIRLGYHFTNLITCVCRTQPSTSTDKIRKMSATGPGVQPPQTVVIERRGSEYSSFAVSRARSTGAAQLLLGLLAVAFQIGATAIDAAFGDTGAGVWAGFFVSDRAEKQKRQLLTPEILTRTESFEIECLSEALSRSPVIRQGLGGNFCVFTTRQTKQMAIQKNTAKILRIREGPDARALVAWTEKSNVPISSDKIIFCGIAVSLGRDHRNDSKNKRILLQGKSFKEHQQSFAILCRKAPCFLILSCLRLDTVRSPGYWYTQRNKRIKSSQKTCTHSNTSL